MDISGSQVGGVATFFAHLLVCPCLPVVTNAHTPVQTSHVIACNWGPYTKLLNADCQCPHFANQSQIQTP